MVKTTIKDLEKMLCRFNVNDLKEYVFPAFPEILWSDAKKYIVEKEMTLNIRSFSLVMAKAARAFDENSIKKRIGTLTLIEASLQATKMTKRRWRCFQMHSGNDMPNDYSIKDIQRAIRRQYNIAGIHVICQVIFHDAFYWILIIVKKIVKGSGLVFQRPLLFAFNSCHSYLFAGQQMQSKNMLMALTVALKFENFVNSSLEGCSIVELLRILNTKRQRCHDESSTPLQLKNVSYEPVKPVVDGYGNLVYPHNKNRRSYAEGVFGKKPPVIDKLTLIAPNFQWPSDSMDDPAEAASEIAEIRVTISAPNVYKYLTNLAEIGATSVPFPSYMEGLVKSGKNTIILRTPKAAR